MCTKHRNFISKLTKSGEKFNFRGVCEAIDVQNVKKCRASARKLNLAVIEAILVPTLCIKGAHLTAHIVSCDCEKSTLPFIKLNTNIMSEYVNNDTKVLVI